MQNTLLANHHTHHVKHQVSNPCQYQRQNVRHFQYKTRPNIVSVLLNFFYIMCNFDYNGKDTRTIKSGVIGNLVIVTAMKNSQLAATAHTKYLT